MKKPKFIAIVLVLAIMLMGAGYAAWNETVTINNTVGTGELRVEFVDTRLLDYGQHPHAGVYDNKTLLPEPDNFTAVIQHGAKTTTFTVSDMYPGATAFFEVLIQNLGTIPAVIEDVKVEFDDDCSELMKKELIVWGQVQHRRPGQSEPVEIKTIPCPTPWSTEEEIVRLEELESTLDNLLKGMELHVGDYITFDVTDEYKQQIADNFEGYDIDGDNCLYFHLPMNVENELENETAKFDISLDFKQFNK